MHSELSRRPLRFGVLNCQNLTTDVKFASVLAKIKVLDVDFLVVPARAWLGAVQSAELLGQPSGSIQHHRIHQS
jgi:hypothetical protein